VSTFRRKGAVDGAIYDLPSAGQAAYPRSFLDALLAMGASAPQADASVLQRELVSASAYPAKSGTWRAANADAYTWRNAGDTGDVGIGRDLFDAVLWGGVPLSRGPLAAATVRGVGSPAQTFTTGVTTPFQPRPTEVDTRSSLLGPTFTAPLDGTYLVCGQVLLQGGAMAANQAIATLVINGTPNTAHWQRLGGSASAYRYNQCFAFAIRATAATTLQVAFMQNSGGGLSLNIGAKLAFIRLWGAP